MQPKKKAATMVISKLNEYAENMKPAADVDGAESSDPKHIAVEEIMDAIERKDKAALADALNSFVEMCSYAGE